MLHGFPNDSAGAAAEAAVRVVASNPSAKPVSDERLEGWFRDHFDTLWRFAARLGIPRQHVDDVVQEVFITASRRAATIASGAERRFLIAVTIKIAAN